MDKGVKKTFPSETGGTTQYTAHTSSLPKDEGKGTAFQSISHMPNSFDVLDSLLVKLSEEKNEPSHNRGIVKGASEKGMKICSNNTARESKFKQKNLSQPKNQEHGEFQITNHLLDPMATQSYLLTKFPVVKEQNQNWVLGISRPLPSSLDPHHMLDGDDKQKISERVSANFPQNFSLEEGKSKHQGVLGSSLTDYRSREKLEPDVPVTANINRPHPSSHLEILPSSQTNLSNEQPKESKVKVRGKKKKKKNGVGKFLKRKREESFQITVRCLLEMVEMMEIIVQNLISRQRESKS